MNTCAHTWIYIGSKRQNIWRCAFCDEYRIDDPTQKREWQELTDEEMFSLWVRCPAETEDRFAFARAIEQALKEKNGG